VRWKRGTTSGPHNLPLIGGGDWNDGMNRVGIEGRGESTWLGGSFTARSTALPICVSDVARTSQQPAIASAPPIWRRLSNTAPGMANGTYELIMMMALPWAPQRTRNARLIQSPNPGRSFPAAGTRNVPPRLCNPVSEHLVQRSQRLVLLFTPPLTRRCATLVTSKAILPVCERMVDSNNACCLMVCPGRFSG